MTTTLSDMVTPAAPQVYSQAHRDYMSAGCDVGSLWNLTLVQATERARAVACNAAISSSHRFWDDSNYFSDGDVLDSTDTDVCDNCVGIAMGEEVIRRQEQGKCFAESLVTEWVQGCGEDRAFDVMVDNLNPFWTNIYERITMASLIGIYASDAADDADLITDLVTDHAADDTPSNSDMNYQNWVYATHLRDCVNLTDAIVHPVVYMNLKLKGLQVCPCNPNAIGEARVPEFLMGPNGERIFRATKRTRAFLELGGDPAQYLTILFRPGFFEYGEGDHPKPMVVSYDECAREDRLHTNHRYVIHPRGWSFLEGSVAAESPTLTELQAAANWAQVAPTDSQGIHFIISTGAPQPAAP